MRFALANLLNDHYQLGLDLNMENMFTVVPNVEVSSSKSDWKKVERFKYREKGVPLIAASHFPWSERFADKPVVLLLRNPADVLVSRYYHTTRAIGGFQGSLAQFAADGEVGIPSLIGYLQSWFEHLNDRNMLVITYEELRSDPEEPFAALCQHLGLETSHAQQIRALAASTVDKMRALEAAHGVGSSYQHDHNDPQAQRVRQARVGSFHKELPAEVLENLLSALEQAGLNQQLRTLGLDPESI